MSSVHRLLFRALLGFLGVSLLLPGLFEMFRPSPGSGLIPQSVDARNQLRALHGMMAALGALALWVFRDPDRSRTLVLALGAVMAFLSVSRLYSLLADGVPSPKTLSYLLVEAAMAIAFLGWPPPG